MKPAKVLKYLFSHSPHAVGMSVCWYLEPIEQREIFWQLSIEQSEPLALSDLMVYSIWWQKPDVAHYGTIDVAGIHYSVINLHFMSLGK